MSCDLEFNVIKCLQQNSIFCHTIKLLLQWSKTLDITIASYIHTHNLNYYNWLICNDITTQLHTITKCTCIFTVHTWTNLQYIHTCNFYYSNPLFVFTGGTPVGYVTPDVNISLMKGKSLSMLSCDSVIVDFITVPSSPYMNG